MPKVELHVHLEGAIRPATLLQLARRNGVRLPVQDECQFSPDMGPSIFGQSGPLAEMTHGKLLLKNR
jgi:hypothetical protein